MKKIIAGIVLFFCGTVLFAQQKQPIPFKYYNPGKQKKVIPFNYSQPFVLPDAGKVKAGILLPALAQSRLSHVLPNGNKVYLLPGDNMPCVVPDILQLENNVIRGRNDMDEGINKNNSKD